MKTDNQTDIKLPALLIIMVISMLLIFNWPLFVTTTIDRNYQLKSAFIANFIRYTLWESLPNNHLNFCPTDRFVTTIVELNFIGEKTGFIQNTGHINFYHPDNKLRFEVNSQRLEMANINISSNLLRLARPIDIREDHDGH